MITNSPRTTVETAFFPCCAGLVVASLAPMSPVPSNFWIQVYRWEKCGKVLDEGMSRTDYSLKVVRWWDATAGSVQLVSADITADTELCTSRGACHRHHSKLQHRSGYGLHRSLHSSCLSSPSGSGHMRFHRVPRPSSLAFLPCQYFALKLLVTLSSSKFPFPELHFS